MGPRIRPRGVLGGLIIVVLALASWPALAVDFITILTGGTSGVYYPLGIALSDIYADAVPGVRVQVQATKASVENLTLLQQGRGDVAFALGDALDLAWEGDEAAGFKSKADKLRVIAAIYPNYIHFVVRADSGINSLADLKGKRISVGAPNSGTAINARTIIEAAGLSESDFAAVEHLPYAELVELMKTGRIDGTLLSSGIGVPALRDLAASVDVRFLPIPDELIRRVGPPYLPLSIPAGTYPGQTADVPTAGVLNFLVTREGMAPDTVYVMTKSMFEHLDQLISAQPAAKGIDPAAAAPSLRVPFHPGAERYYKEKGLM